MNKNRKRSGAGIRAAAGVLLLLAAGQQAEAAGRPGSTAGDSGTVTVCILDSGCDDPDADGRNYLGETDDLSDPVLHGALVYRILREKAPDAKLFMLKCFDSTETLPRDGDSIMARAVRDAVDVYHADLINLSWAGMQDSDRLHEAVRYAAEEGAVLVAAAGNLSLSTPLGSEIYPAAWDEVIGVSGAERGEEGELVSSLWYLHGSAVFVCADPSAGIGGNGEPVKGTSFAAPRVTAVLARYLGKNGSTRNAGSTWNVGKTGNTRVEKAGSAQPGPGGADNTETAEEYLKSIAEDAGEPGYDTTFGWGYIE